MSHVRIAALMATTALLGSCAANTNAPSAMANGGNVAATAPARVDNFMLVDQNLEGHELYRLGDAPAIVLISQANGDAAIRKLAPALNKLAADYGAKGVEFRLINSSAKERESLAAEAAAAGLKTPILWDRYQLVGESLGVTRSAEAFVVNPKNWTVAWRGSAADLGPALEAVLAGKAPAAGAAGAGAPIAFPNRGEAKFTYVKDVAPILEKRCVSCHSAGGIGPFAMGSYELTKGFAPMIREVVRTDRMPPYNADPNVGHFSDTKNLTADEIRTLVHWVESGAPRGTGADPLAAKKIVAEAWPLGKPDLIIDVPAFKVPASGVVDYQRPATPNPLTEGKWIRATSVKPGDRQAVHHLLSGWMADATAKGSNEGRWRSSVGRYAVGSEADVFDGDVGTYLPAGGSVGFQMHYTPYGKEATDATQVGVYFRKDPPKYLMRQVAISDPTIEILPNAARHMEQAYLEFPKDALLYDAFVHAHYRAYSSDLWLQTPDGKKTLLLALPRYDFNWQRAYTFAQPVKIPAGSRLIARYVYDNSKRNPANPDPKIRVTWGEQSWEEMLFTQISFRWMDETAAQQVDSDARFNDTRFHGIFDDNLDGKIAMNELRGQMGMLIGGAFAKIDTNKDGGISVAEWVAGRNEIPQFRGGQQRRPAAAPPEGPPKAVGGR